MNNISNIIGRIAKAVRPFTVPSVTKVSFQREPYRVLISCILSLRTKDKTTVEAGERLFKVAACPEDMVKLSEGRIRKLIYPVGFYRRKAAVLKGISQKLIKDFKGQVPNTLDGLLSLKGVGRKTANLVLGLGFGMPAICVDTHVHRISNRLGWVKTKEPFQTEEALEKIIPRRLWIDLNTVLVTFGQNICLPVSPLCSRCAIRASCKKIGVKKSR